MVLAVILKCIHIASSGFAASELVQGFCDGIKHTSVSGILKRAARTPGVSSSRV